MVAKYLGPELTTKAHCITFYGNGNPYLDRVTVIGLYFFVKIHQIMYLNRINFIISKLFLNKHDKNKIAELNFIDKIKTSRQTSSMFSKD